MVEVEFQFNRAKAMETILYLANRVSNHDVYGLCKLIYLADKTSLEKYGRFVFGETYVAMEQGATPSNAYDMLKQIEEAPIPEMQRRGYEVIPLRDTNLDWLSKADLECLDKTIAAYGKASYLVRRCAAHDTAWARSWEEKGTAGSIGIPVVRIAESLENSEDLVDYLSTRDAE